MQTQSRLIPAKDVKSLIGNISDMTLWRWLHEEKYESLKFPKPTKICTRNDWDASKINEWIESRA